MITSPKNFIAALKKFANAHANLIDFMMRAALAVFFAFTAGIYFHNALALWVDANIAQMSLAQICLNFSILSSALYTMLIACLYVLRHRPMRKLSGIMPSLAAILGGFMMFGLMWFKPCEDLPIVWRVVGGSLIIIGNGFSVYILTKLGRSFSILPEGRKLVTAGPYKIIRHPLYLAEAFATIGVMILFLSTGAVILVIMQTALQILRMRYEERVLTQAFPEYEKYTQHTFRLLPGVY